MAEDNKMRLQRFLSRAGVDSRRHAEKLIENGSVKVNGKVVTQLGFKVDPKKDEVEYNSQILKITPDFTIMLNKPTGYVTSMQDPHARLCVASLIPLERYPSLYPIGRLDKDTSGLLLFSTDGDFGNNIIHPKSHIPKTYIAEVDGILTPKDIGKLENGIMLDGKKTQPAIVESIDENLKENTHTLSITIFEGKKRQIRRMFGAIKHPVATLRRISIGSVELGDLKVGEWRALSQDEISSLKNAK